LKAYLVRNPDSDTSAGFHDVNISSELVKDLDFFFEKQEGYKSLVGIHQTTNCWTTDNYNYQRKGTIRKGEIFQHYFNYV